MTRAALTLEEVEERVLGVIRDLAQELGGRRALRAVSRDASLERDVGLGSLERVELLVRLETAFGQPLDDRFLEIGTPAELAAALLETEPTEQFGITATQEPPVAIAHSVTRAATIHESLWRRAQADPDLPHVFLREDDGRELTITYGELLDDARAVAGGLREHGVRRGEAVALMLPTSRDFLTAFQGILLCGAVPVPIYPPVRFDRLEEYAERQSAILADAAVTTLITVSRGVPVAALFRTSTLSLRDVVTVGDLCGAGVRWNAPAGASSDPALIQYTSGSSGHPKGVLLSHANILANIDAIAAGVGLRQTDVVVSWLPLYHDMGLIGSWLFSLVHGNPIDIQSPLSFLARPERWLWAIHRRRATLSPAPNFAYELCVRKIPEDAIECLDLSSWRCALNGAEPVNPDTLDRFARRFAPKGFRREALLPVYGLAECSVALCFPPPGRGPVVDRVNRHAFAKGGRAEVAAADDDTPLSFVSVGKPLPQHEVRLVDESGRVVPDRQVGRLVFRGPSAMAGYFRKPDETAAITDPDGWIDSGDLAYMGRDDEIFIAGRVKDLIIKAGRNLVPQEIEEVAASVEGVRRGCVVAFGVAHPTLATENLVIVSETRVRDEGHRDRIVAALTERIAAAIGVPPDAVELVPPGTVPKTSSGKIRRTATRELYLAGALSGATRPLGAWLATRLRLLTGLAQARLQPWLAAIPGALYTIYLAAVLTPLALSAWMLAAVIPGRKRVCSLERLGARIALFIAGCRITVDGLENFAPSGPLLLASNHASYADIPALLAAMPRHILFVSKREVTRWPVIGTFIRRSGHVPVDRMDSHQSVADAGRIGDAIGRGEAVLVFPEGTFTAASGLRPFRLGVFKTSVETGVPVVPISISGTRRIMRGDRWILRPGRIHIRIGHPIAPEGTGWHDIVGLRDRVSREIAAHCGEPVLDLVASGPPR